MLADPGDELSSMMIHIHRREKVLEIVIDRTLKRNALNAEMYENLTQAFNDVNSEEDSSVVLIRAKGDYFCAGQDVNQLASSASPLPLRDRAVFHFMRSVLSCERPIVAAVQGPAIGIGATMLMHFDFLYVADDAWLSFPFSTLGLSPEFGASVLLSKLAGTGTAARALLLGEKVNAQQMVSCGWAAGSGAPETIQAAANAAAIRLAGLSKSAVRATRSLMRERSNAVSEELLIRELEVLESLRSTPEHHVAMEAWRKR